MLKPTALAAGHYECRSLKQSLPILQDLLALEVRINLSNTITACELRQTVRLTERTNICKARRENTR